MKIRQTKTKYWETYRYETITKWLFFCFVSNLQSYHFKIDFQKVDKHTGDKWLIHGTKALNATRTIRCKAWHSPVEYTSRKCLHDMTESEGILFNSIFKENVQGWRLLRKYYKGLYMKNSLVVSREGTKWSPYQWKGYDYTPKSCCNRA